MTTFTIDSENNITAHAGVPSGADESTVFHTQKELAKLADGWPASRLVEIWNSFAGVAPFDDLKEIAKFTNREVAIRRIFKAIGRLGAAVAKPAAKVAPAKAITTKAAPKATKADVPRKIANVKPMAVLPHSSGSKNGSKKADVIAMMRRKDGVSLEEIMQKTGWQRHTVRGFVSGALTKKMGLKVESFRSSDKKERCYRIAE